MGKRRVSIYIDEDFWEHCKEQAYQSRMSASAMIQKVLDGDIVIKFPKDHRLVTVEREKVEAVIDDVDLEAENEKLMEKRKKVAELKNSVSEFTGGYSKGVK